VVGQARPIFSRTCLRGTASADPHSGDTERKREDSSRLLDGPRKHWASGVVLPTSSAVAHSPGIPRLS
jgi:hypothetical protein